MLPRRTEHAIQHVNPFRLQPVPQPHFAVPCEDGWLEAGYRYVSIDDCWMTKERDAQGRQAGRPLKEKRREWNARMSWGVRRDSESILYIPQRIQLPL